jgi:hypothetical protein
MLNHRLHALTIEDLLPLAVRFSTVGLVLLQMLEDLLRLAALLYYCYITYVLALSHPTDVWLT